MQFDYKKLGMMSGIEIHQQLDTHKLFCSCPSVIREDEPDFEITRKIHAVAGELGEVDPAALHELLRDRSFVYEGYKDTTCLVELDEEPPHPINKEALKIAVEVALMLNAKVVDEFHVMRKTVIDGSNTSGFQRTILIATDGYIDSNDGRVGIPSICLEEDAARIIDKADKVTRYRLDRLGIPLIEIGTAPDIKSPEQVKEVAQKIGAYLRATGKVKRGLGTIRQDVNVSVKGGRRIEVKGAQNLNDLPKIVKNEVSRQVGLIEIQKALKGKKLSKKITDVSTLFSKTGSKVISNSLSSGGMVGALALPGFKGLLGKEIMPDHRFGTELAHVARSVAGVRGIFHSDEMPAYGISESEVKVVAQKLGSESFVLVAERKEVVEKALGAIFNRCKAATEGVPEETRKADREKTIFMRPLPGSARMYPETDEPVSKLSEEEMASIKKGQSKSPEEIKKGLEKMGLNQELASQILNSRHLERFKELSKTLEIKPSVIASTILGAPKDLRIEEVEDVLNILNQKKIAKESVAEILEEAAKTGESIGSVISKKDLFLLGRAEVKKRIKQILGENPELAKKKAMGPLMGLVMSQLRGKASVDDVKDILKELT